MSNNIDNKIIKEIDNMIMMDTWKQIKEFFVSMWFGPKCDKHPQYRVDQSATIGLGCKGCRQELCKRMDYEEREKRISLIQEAVYRALKQIEEEKKAKRKCKK